MRAAIAAVVGMALVLGACSHTPATTPEAAPSPSAAAAGPPRDGTYSLSLTKAHQVATASRFFEELRRVRIDGAFGRKTLRRTFAPHEVTVVDCDYRKEKPVTYEGHAEVMQWLRASISDHTVIDVRRFWNENPDRAGGKALGVSVYRRYSDTLRALDYPSIKVREPVTVGFNRFAQIRYLTLGAPGTCVPIRGSVSI